MATVALDSDGRKGQRRRSGRAAVQPPLERLGGASARLPLDQPHAGLMLSVTASGGIRGDGASGPLTR
jgi:hypothetical protein